MEASNSPIGTLNKIDYFKTLRGGAITFVAGLAVEMLVELQAFLEECAKKPDVCSYDFGEYSFVLPVGVAVIGMALELIRRWNVNYRG